MVISMFFQSAKIFAALLVFALSSAWAASTKDLLNADHLGEHLKATGDQKEHIAKHVAALRNIVVAYQTERARRTNEALLWQGHIPKLKDLKSLRKSANDSASAAFDALKTALNNKQIERLDKLIGKGDVFAIPIAQHPYYHVQNSPLFPEFSGKKTAYKLTLPSQPDPANTWTYAQMLKIWTVRNFMPSVRPIDDLQHAPSIAAHPDWQTREVSVSDRYRLVRSPLLISATLYVPDLVRSEFDMLQTHYDSLFARTWDDYAAQNRLASDIQIRLKFNTIYDKAYLDLNRWTIYLEDSEEIGYEPNKIEERAFYPLEALKVSVPGREIEVTDVFGTYISPTYTPGEKARYFAEPPTEMTYLGNEKLLVLYFPAQTVMGTPVISARTKHLKLIVQSHETDFGRCELMWAFKKPKSEVRPPKD